MKFRSTLVLFAIVLILFALVYVFEGVTRLALSEFPLDKGKFARLSRDGLLSLTAEKGTRLLVITGKPIGEAIVHHGPFVMNSEQEIMQAIQDYNAGTFV